ncbi:ABC transporter permease [Proteiniborus sp. MB09-C3]|uniref:ABC transporter permease n=1 Tax=Proteiniborus sp. MB09-C3 TaxID=3050072 RepID=UPI002552BBF7|nr:ABC transporter permease [Proteiniborus sp. MB09-C3]WIV11877.1 ABC transporter permease [Proteiniborus sp. MB09-C3]
MWTIIQTELLKLKRKKMMIGIFILTTLLAVFAIERACSISRGSSYMDSFGDLYTLAFKNLSIIYLPIVLGMFATSLFFDEHKNDTLKELLIIPVSKGQLYFSKIITVFLLSLGLCLYTYVFTVLGGFMAGGFPDFNMQTIWQAFILFAEGGILVPLAMLPIVFLAVLGQKSYLLPIGATLLYLLPIIILPAPLMGIHPLASVLCVYSYSSPAAADMVNGMARVIEGVSSTPGYVLALINLIIVSILSSVLSVIVLKKQNL